MSVDVEKEVVAYAAQLLKGKGVAPKADTPLLSSGLLDSMQVLDLIEHLEKLTGVSLAEEELSPDHFETARSIARFFNDKDKKRA